MNNRNPNPSKVKSLGTACLAWIVATFLGSAAWGGEIRIESGEEKDTIISVNPNAPSTNPGSVIIESGENQDTVMEAHPQAPPETWTEPIIITPEIRVREHAPCPPQHSFGKP